MNASSRQDGETHELAGHLDRIRRLPRLTRAEEQELAVRAQRGDVAAKQKLVSHALWLVVHVARKQRRGSVRLDDLVQEGSLGLMRAVESFDPWAGTRFSTYAVWWIRAYVGKYLQQARSSVRPRRGTVAQNDVSLDAPSSDEGGPAPLEHVPDEEPSPEEAYAAAERARDVRLALGRARPHVNDLGWDILQSRLAQDAPETLQQIAQRWDISKQRVGQVEVATREVLRRHLRPVHDREAA